MKELLRKLLRLFGKKPPNPPKFPKRPSKKVYVRETIVVENKETFIGGNKLYVSKGLGDGGQSEKQKPLFKVYGVIKGVHYQGADGIHLYSADAIKCACHNVGEDAMTLKTGDNLVDGCFFKEARDKVIQVNSKVTATIKNCYAKNFGRFLRLNPQKNPRDSVRVEFSNNYLEDGSTGILATGRNVRVEGKGNIMVNVGKDQSYHNGAKGNVGVKKYF